MKHSLFLFLLFSLTLLLPLNGNEGTLTGFFETEVRSIIKATLESIPGESDAKKQFADVYGNESKKAYSMLMTHFTMGGNDLSSFRQCNDANYKFIIGTIVSPDKAKPILTSAVLQYIEKKSTFGFCIAKAAYDEAFIKEFIIALNTQTTNLIAPYIDLANLYLTDYSSVENEARATAQNGFSIFLIVIFLFQLCLCIAVSLLAWFNCSFFNQSNSLIQFLNAYNLKKSLEALFDSNSNRKSDQKDSTLTYVNGLRGISMILFVCGSMILYISLFTLPIIWEESYFKLINGLFYCLLVLGIRHSSHIFLSCSGFSFFTKYYLYLDECCMKYEEDITSITKLIEFQALEIKEDDEEELDEPRRNSNFEIKNIVLNKEDTNELRVKYSIRFFLNHLNKYILLLLSVLFLKYLMYYIVKVTPNYVTWYKDVISSISIGDVIGHLLFYKSLYPEITTDTQRCLLDNFYIPLSEALYLTVFTPLFYIIYKKKLKAPIIIIALYLLFFIAKVLTFALMDTKGNLGLISTVNQNPLLNTSFFLIGMLFGVFNYVIQKGIDSYDVIKGSKQSYVTAVFITQRLRKWSFIPLMYLVLAALIVAIIFTNFIITLAVKDVNSLADSTALHVVNYISMDMMTLFVHLLCFTLYIRGEQFITSFLSVNYWSKFNKHYYSYLLLIPIISLFILFRSESRIGIDYPTICIYIFLLGVLLPLFLIFFYLTLEYPIKALFKLMLSKIYKN